MAIHISGEITVKFLDYLTGPYIITTQEEKLMSDSVRMRVVLDFPVDPTTANERKLKAISKEMRNTAQILLVKEHEITLVEDVESVNVHVHKSGPDACDACVRDLALDGRS